MIISISYITHRRYTGQEGYIPASCVRHAEPYKSVRRILKKEMMPIQVPVTRKRIEKKKVLKGKVHGVQQHPLRSATESSADPQVSPSCMCCSILAE